MIWVVLICYDNEHSIWLIFGDIPLVMCYIYLKNLIKHCQSAQQNPQTVIKIQRIAARYKLNSYEDCLDLARTSEIGPCLFPARNPHLVEDWKRAEVISVFFRYRISSTRA